MRWLIILTQLSQYSIQAMDWKPMNFGSIPSIGIFKYDAVQQVAVASYQRLR
jgi:hypothetical protein